MTSEQFKNLKTGDWIRTASNRDVVARISGRKKNHYILADAYCGLSLQGTLHLPENSILQDWEPLDAEGMKS